MFNFQAIEAKVKVRIHFAILLAAFALSSCGGSATGISGVSTGTPGVPTAPSTDAAINVKAAITAVQATWAATPLPSTGTIHYFCDCRTGASGNCIAGSDANAGISASAPKQSIAALQAMLPVANGDTVAFCKGGSFAASSQITPNVSGCAAGTTCVDFRDYASPAFTSAAKPVITSTIGAPPPNNSGQLWNFNNAPSGGGGVRIFNLDFENPGGSTNFNIGLSYFQHDIWYMNNTSNGFQDHVYNNSNYGHNNNIYFEGNNFINAPNIGYLGGSDNSTLSFNNWVGNGNGPTVFQHTIYLNSGSPLGADTHFKVEGNFIDGTPAAGASCVAGVFNSHGGFDYLVVKNNYVYIDPAKVTAGCYGMNFNNVTGNSTEPVFFRNTTITGNTIVNGGALAMNVSNCPYCSITNNTIIMDWSATIQVTGIDVPGTVARTTPIVDDVGTNYTVSNNTIYFSSNMNSNNGNRGIRVESEGTGHIIANNAIYISAGKSACLAYTPPSSVSLSSFVAFSDYNDCYQGGATTYFEWVTGDTLATWRSNSGFDTHSILTDPQFTNTNSSIYNFKPQAGLSGAGTHAYAPTLDALSVTRPNPPSIGAYE